ncbi:MFS transporter [Streptomyces sp. 8L]|uniref:MFS transporter n=1 Tax=Streptomyces sp. 8L TaxID=2877242 RepID=UPI001CD8173E|nr:MFS transporter [Streptomyces sp. 8L]MCA1224266.1 MFS transporter [Streptomyces sp. 8L]
MNERTTSSTDTSAHTEPAPTEPTPAEPGRRRAGWALAVTAVAGFMAALDNLVVTTALPSIRADLGGSLDDLEWTVNAYTLTFAVLLMFGAALGDRFGRRRLFVAGIATFSAASAAAALSSGVGPLIAARAVQGVGAAIMMPLALTLLTAAVPAARRGAYLGIFSAFSGLAVAAGPLVGGSLTEHLSWQWIFWLNVPVGVVLLPLARLRLAESRGPRPRLDVTGTVLISTGLFGIVYALVTANSNGWTSARVLLGLILGAVLVGLFVRHSSTDPNAMLPLRMFRNRTFAGINAASLLMFVGMFGSIFLLSQFLQGVLGYSPTEAGLRMLPWTAMPLVVSPIAGVLHDRFGGRLVVGTGLALQAAGLAWFAAVIAPGVSYGTQLPALILSGVGMALYFAPAGALVMSGVREGDQGIASGANNALREVGGALGVATLGAVFSARGGYGSAQAFVDGTRPALWIGAAVVAVASLVALTVLGRHRTTAENARDARNAQEEAPSAEARGTAPSAPVVEAAGGH